MAIMKMKKDSEMQCSAPLLAQMQRALELRHSSKAEDDPYKLEAFENP